ncbi:Malonyl-(acyl-carrier protein) O-methyltransferase [Crenothrix polyspora]|uniref:Malonyl-[acyl-carrier protein] O-methyltransferase n=1 Tax=Crenothrix polyspora TaxID=360316 RepID=A0A1R4H8T4_9GAMM|nr:malonyl-ACP O-methyltransferase BioC [Crenothrix polyspora]SJM92441.1 Malonyl-(acyl-carrier protein) O-methyltransferase [Crenothrix polyspora]
MSFGFNLDKHKIKQAFSQSVLTYNDVTQLQRTVGKALLQHIKLPDVTDTLLDLGCGTGFLTAELLTLLPCERMIALDMALPMVQAARLKLRNFDNVTYICADAQQLPIAEHAVGHVFSNLMLQWCVDLEAVFTEIRRVLKPGGQLVFSIFGPQTLQELKQAWAVVDNYNHVNYFYSMSELEAFLRQAGFTILKYERQSYVSSYESVLVLMKELKQMGAHNVNGGRNKRLTTKNQMQNMMAAYPKCIDTDRILATFDVITLVVRA